MSDNIFALYLCVFKGGVGVEMAFLYFCIFVFVYLCIIKGGVGVEMAEQTD